MFFYFKTKGCHEKCTKFKIKISKFALEGQIVDYANVNDSKNIVA